MVAPQDLLYLTASIDSVTYSHAMHPLFMEASSSVTGSMHTLVSQTTAMHSYVATYQSYIAIAGYRVSDGVLNACTIIPY